ncbi:hypothetical protein HWV62_10677 [Athelia sp. TMB]|nr:hypothetical protein HWV62_10677 [Athelia sp. TMB]
MSKPPPKKKSRIHTAPVPLFDSSTRGFLSTRITSTTVDGEAVARPAFFSQIIASLPQPLFGRFDEAIYARPHDLDDDDDIQDTPLDVDGAPPSNSDTLESGLPGISIKKKVNRRYVNSDIPLTTWALYRDEYLDEMMALEGRGRFAGQCSGCGERDPLYRCKECTHGSMWCQKCLVERHVDNPLHIVQKWNRSFFERTTLRALGLRVQLGHAAGHFCPSFKVGNKDFVVIHTNGIHSIHLEFCRCRSVPRHVQLLRAGWFPATPLKPQTCATMEVLRQFHTLHLQGKVTGYSFYRSLEYLTDGTGLYTVPERLDAWMLMVREWRHLKMLKRAGRAYDPAGVANTPPGSLAILCRACPVPGMNLPPFWDTADPSRAWLYMLTVGMDANYRLRSKVRGINVDPHLSPGWGYFVKPGPYGEFVADYADDEDISSCVGFQALLNMLTKKSKGLRATGMGAVSCSRHQMFRPQGLGDLQKGERQCNMDYIFASSVVGVGVNMLTISYDVGCQWWTRFSSVRRDRLPAHLQNLPAWMRALVPKFHLQSHQEGCHSAFSFNYAPGSGRTEGEGVERNWDELNGQAPSTAEMLPGHRWETLDDCCGWANWRKAMGLGSLLLKRLLLAIPEAIRTANDFRRFDTRLRAENPAEVAEMERELVEWQADHSKPDPFRLPKSSITMDQVRYVMAEEDKERAALGTTFVHTVSASTFLLLGIEIETLQQTLRTEVGGRRNQTLLQSTTIVERRTTLLKRVARFRELQRLYMVGFDPVEYARTKEEDRARAASRPSLPPPDHVENFPLFMPSGLNAGRDVDMFCPNGLAELEARLRFAEASDSLERLRHFLRTRSFNNIFKVANVTGQIRNTRAKEKQSRIDDNVRSSALKYRRARAALKSLRGPGDWERNLQVLNNTDIRALNERDLTRQEQDAEAALHAANGVITQQDRERAEETRRNQTGLSVGEGHRAPSWIWFTNTGAESMNDPLTRKALRVEWSKAGARAERWLEEVVELDEEMRRVIESSVTQQEHWRAQPDRRPLPETKDKYLREGLSAYAAEHIDREGLIIKLWGEKWKAVRLLADPLIAGNIPDDRDYTTHVGEVEEMEIELPDDTEEDDFEMVSAE